jgi:hypothetical protein
MVYSIFLDMSDKTPAGKDYFTGSGTGSST